MVFEKLAHMPINLKGNGLVLYQGLTRFLALKWGLQLKVKFLRERVKGMVERGLFGSRTSEIKGLTTG